MVYYNRTSKNVNCGVDPDFFFVSSTSGIQATRRGLVLLFLSILEAIKFLLSQLYGVLVSPLTHLILYVCF